LPMLIFVIFSRALPVNDYPESSAFARLAPFYKNGPFMVLFHNTPGKRQAQSPSPFFGGKAGFKNLFQVGFADAFAGI